ncbi:3-hydroxyacyl-CoA dehydrogenase NAD-binding domain-containing protein, partial [uncultured Chryseobacterium sp.]
MTNVGIIGAGTMGIGIAQVAATNGCKVWVYDANARQVETATLGLEKTLTKLVDKQKISGEKMTEILANISIATELKDFKDCELIIEAIIENKEIKTKVFTELENHVSETCIIGSNTSSISITSLSAELKHPERFIGIHFFNPAPLMPLVEVIPSLLTGKSLPEKIYSLMKDWGKTPVIAKDIPGFIVNRIARPYYGEGLRIVEENIATVEQVDDAMKTLGNFKMGPFELMDLIGVDVNFSVTTTVYKEYFYDPKYKPSLLQQRMSEAKLHGRKTGKGFYDYAEGAAKPEPQKDDSLYQQIFMRI